MNENSQLLTDAVYIINHLEIAFKMSEDIMDMQGTRTDEPFPREYMHRIHIPEYLKRDMTRFMKNYQQLCDDKNKIKLNRGY